MDESIKECNYLQLSLNELKLTMEDYNSKNIDINLLYYRMTNLIFWLGAFLDKKYNEIEKEDREKSLAIRFACNVLKHDKNIFEVGKKVIISCGVSGDMFSGEDMLINSVNIPTVRWRDLDANCIKNQNGLDEYNKFFKNKEVWETISIIEKIIIKYS